MKRPTPKAMQKSVDTFNGRHKVGDEITVYPGSLDDPSKVVRIVEPGAYVLSGHTAVVQVTGGHGCIALTHVAA